jgi:hypothetical protein
VCIFRKEGISLLKRYDLAIQHFHDALRLIEDSGVSSQLWPYAACNLGHSYRKERLIFTESRNFVQAKYYFTQILDNDQPKESAYTGLGMVCYKEENYIEAIAYLHKCLELNPANKRASALLDQILTVLANDSKKNPLPVLNNCWLDTELLEMELENKIANHNGATEKKTSQSMSIAFDNESLEDIDVEESAIHPRLYNESTITRQRTRGRQSVSNELSPDVFESSTRPRGGLLDFREAGGGDRTPPNTRKKLFSFELLEDDSPITSMHPSVADSDNVFGDPSVEMMDMDMDTGEDEEDL